MARLHVMTGRCENCGAKVQGKSHSTEKVISCPKCKAPVVLRCIPSFPATASDPHQLGQPKLLEEAIPSVAIPDVLPNEEEEPVVPSSSAEQDTRQRRTGDDTVKSKLRILCPNCKTRNLVGSTDLGTAFQCTYCGVQSVASLEDVEATGQRVGLGVYYDENDAATDIHAWKGTRAALSFWQNALTLLLLCVLTSPLLAVGDDIVTLAVVLVGGATAALAGISGVVSIVLLLLYLPNRTGAKTWVICSVIFAITVGLLIGFAFLNWSELPRSMKQLVVVAAPIVMLVAHLLFVGHLKAIGKALQDRNLCRGVNMYWIAYGIGSGVLAAMFAGLVIAEKGLGLRVGNRMASNLFVGVGVILSLFFAVFLWFLIRSARRTVTSFLQEMKYLGRAGNRVL